MKRLTVSEVEEGFRVLGLGTQMERERFMQFHAPEASDDNRYEFIKIDFMSSEHKDVTDAKLA